MIHQIYIVKDNGYLYEINFKESVNKDEFNSLLGKLKEDALSNSMYQIGVYDNYKNLFKISYVAEKELNLFFFFITGLDDKIPDIKKELFKLKNEFVDLFGDMLNGSIESSTIELITPTIFSIHKNLKPKISLIGFPGVGKSTLVKLIKADEIPKVHVPTASGEVSIIKIGKLYFNLWDFAGQDEFSYLWTSFIKGSDAILLITDSTIENVEQSKFFLELINDEAPRAHSVVIGNKQDLPDALSIERIKEIIGLETYSMVAIDRKNRDFVIRLITNLLEINLHASPLIKPMLEKDKLILKAKEALEQGNLTGAETFFLQASDLCLELGDDSLYAEYYKKAEEIKTMIETKKARSLASLKPPPIPKMTPIDKNIKKISIVDTNLWIKILKYNAFELGVIEKGRSIGGYFINSEELSSIINRLKDLENHDFEQNPNYSIHSKPQNLPFYIIYYNEKFSTGLIQKNKWVSLNEISMETVKNLPKKLNEISKEALNLKPEQITPLDT